MATPPVVYAQQAAVTQAPPTPVAPAPAPLAGDFNSEGVPQTLEAVRSMRAQRSELSDQLVSAMGRRADLAEEIAGAPQAQRPAMEARLQQPERTT